MSEGRKSLKNGGESTQGDMVIIRPSKLAKEGTTGLVAQGVFEKSEPNKFNPAKKDYFVRDTSTDTLYIINSTQLLTEQMEQLNPADETEVEIIYGGQKTSKAGRTFHDWEVFVKA